MSPAQRQTIGRQCRQQVEQRYGLDAMHKKLDEVYRKLARTPFVLTSPKGQAA
jgi:hypothetical protein